MFDPIKGPQDRHSGPAVGDTTEKGDTWHAAVGKINAGFKNIVAWIEGSHDGSHEGVPLGADVDARNAIKLLEETVSSLQIKLDSAIATIEAMSKPAPTPPVEMPPPNPPTGGEGQPAAVDPLADADPNAPAGAAPAA